MCTFLIAHKQWKNTESLNSKYKVFRLSLIKIKKGTPLDTLITLLKSFIISDV
jgi:hypothetical protein